MKSQNSGQFIVVRPQMCGVSNAAWPSGGRSCIATGRMAQRRRFVILTGLGWYSSLLQIQTHCEQYLVMRPRMMRVSQIAAILLLSTGAFFFSALLDWTMFLKHWLTLLVSAVFCILTTLSITHVIFDTRQEEEVSSSSLQVPVSTLATQVSGGEHVPASEIGMPGSLSIPRSQLSLEMAFPDTPMPVPATPLIRVLETIDLSSLDGEPFLSSKPQPSAWSVLSHSEHVDVPNRSM
ncbi:MAG TPA: hypothetical protein VL461_05795 [Dictyobacter sp.]|nr:hypothetical protein [Dictyobacter sp.]